MHLNLSNLTKLKLKKNKRIGRGLGSGKGKTAGRGTKGQKARGKIPQLAPGSGLALYKKLPYTRGWSRRGGNPKRALKPLVVTTKELDAFKSGSQITIESLISMGIVSERGARRRGVKILAKGTVNVALSISVPLSQNAKEIILKAGGKVAS